jgi:hypothetical protein
VKAIIERLEERGPWVSEGEGVFAQPVCPYCRCFPGHTDECPFRAILTALRAGQAWNEAYYEWRFLADKGDGMPVEVEETLQAAETALAAAYEETPE